MIDIIHQKKNTKPNIKLNKLDGNEEQKAVMNNLYSSEISILTGGAGTGKTHVILEIVKKSKHNVAVLSLTGMCVENFKNKLYEDNDIKKISDQMQISISEEISYKMSEKLREERKKTNKEIPEERCREIYNETREEICKNYHYYDCNFINENNKKFFAKQLILLYQKFL